MPAGPWQDPKNFLEDEDDAEKDLKFYRRVTLRKGEKTLKQKAEEEKMQEVLEDEMLFGKKRTTQKKQEQNCGRGKSSEPDRKKQAQATLRKYGTRANTSKEQKFASKGVENDSSNEDTDSSEETNGYNGDGGEVEDDWTSAYKGKCSLLLLLQAEMSWIGRLCVCVCAHARTCMSLCVCVFVSIRVIERGYNCGSKIDYRTVYPVEMEKAKK